MRQIISSIHSMWNIFSFWTYSLHVCQNAAQKSLKAWRILSYCFNFDSFLNLSNVVRSRLFNETRNNETTKLNTFATDTSLKNRLLFCRRRSEGWVAPCLCRTDSTRGVWNVIDTTMIWFIVKRQEKQKKHRQYTVFCIVFIQTLKLYSTGFNSDLQVLHSFIHCASLFPESYQQKFLSMLIDPWSTCSTHNHQDVLRVFL